MTGIVDWNMTDQGRWTATLKGVPAYAARGNEIFYYALERTVMAVGDYDYQAALYETDAGMVGSRDEPKDYIGTLDGGKTAITDENGQPYDLAVLGKRDVWR